MRETKKEVNSTSLNRPAAESMQHAYDDRLIAECRKLAKFLGKDSQLASFLAAYNIVITPKFFSEAEKTGPFLTVITRTQGRRNVFIKDMLLSLAAQSCQDFELLIVLHKCTEDQAREIRSIVDAYHESFRDRIAILECDEGGRSAPLNQALGFARGKYVTALDDDDFVFGHWVETFKDLTADAPLAVLRAASVKQEFELEKGEASVHARSTTWFQNEWPSSYNPIEHLHANYSPFMSLAFPAAVFKDLGLRFDETLQTTEDWDLTTRIIMLCGVISSAEITSVYRWWKNAESSSTVETAETWCQNRARIIERFSAQPILLPSGSASKIVDLIQERLETRSELNRRFIESASQRDWLERHLMSDGRKSPLAVADEALIFEARAVLAGLIESRSWHVTRPLRQAIRAITGNSISEIEIGTSPRSFEEYQRAIMEIRNSTSWKISAPLRVLNKMVRRYSGKNSDVYHEY